METVKPSEPTAVNGALVPVERGDASSDLVPNNLDPARGRVGFWCSFKPEGARQKAIAFNAMTGNCKSIESMIGETINLRDVILQGVDLTNAVTGEVMPAVRTVLIDTDNKLYAGVSKGIHESVKKLIAVHGMPSWTEGILVIPRKQKAKVGFFYYLEAADDAETEPTKQPAKADPKLMAAASSKGK